MKIILEGMGKTFAKVRVMKSHSVVCSGHCSGLTGWKEVKHLQNNYLNNIIKYKSDINLNKHV